MHLDGIKLHIITEYLSAQNLDGAFLFLIKQFITYILQNLQFYESWI